MLLKRYKIENSNVVSTNPLEAKGFVQIKKENQNFFVTIQLNNFKLSAIAYLITETNIAKINIHSPCIYSFFMLTFST